MRFFSVFLAFVMFLFGSATEAGAKGFDRVGFVNAVKEYAYKIVFPEIRCKEEKIHSEDMKNLRAKILDMVESYPESRGVMNELVLADREIGEILESDAFVSDLIKFENIDKSTPNPVPSKSGRINKYSLYFRYSRNFNPFHKSKIMERLEDSIKGDKNVTDEANDIWNDFDSINDEESMKRLAPSIIDRSVSLLTKNVSDDILDPNKACDLFNASARCTIYLKYGYVNDISNDTMYNEYSDFVKKVYKNLKINDYKYASILAMENVCFVTNKFDNALEYAISVKNDAFDSSSSFYRASIIDYICSLTINPIANFPINDKYFNIGYEFSKLFYDIIDKFDPPMLDDDKFLNKVIWRGDKVAEILAKYGYVDEALYEFDYIIGLKPPTAIVEQYKEVVKYCEQRKSELLPNANSYPNFSLDIDIISDDESRDSPSIPVKDDKVIKVFAIPYPIANENKNINIKKLKLAKIDKLNSKKSSLKNLSVFVTYEYIYENDDTIKKFLKDPLENGNNNSFIHIREKEHGLFKGDYNNNAVKNIDIEKEHLYDTKFNFKYTSFGGDKYKIIVKSNPPYNSSNSIILEVWKEYTLRVYGMGKTYFPDTNKINDIFDTSFVKLNIINNDKYLKYYNNVNFTKNKSNKDDIYIIDYIKILKNSEGLSLDYDSIQHKYINIIGCDNLYSNISSNLWGFSCRSYINNNGEFLLDSKISNIFESNKFYLTTIFINYRLLRLNNKKYYEEKTIAHEIGHAFALEHRGLNKTYKHSKNFENHCIMNEGQIETVNPNTFYDFCDNCKMLIRNGVINITSSYYYNEYDSK